MQRESRLGRVLWIVLLVIVGGYVVADFVRSPFSAPRGAAAVPATAATIWAPAGEAGDEGGAVLDDAAAGLELGGHQSVVKTIPGGPAAAIISFLSRRRPGHGQLLAITSTTLADLAQDRHETLVPGASEEAALARALLRHAKPVGMLAEVPLEVAVEHGSPIRSGAELIASLTGAPAAQLFGIDDDTYSRDELAALVEGAGVEGEVHFSVFQSAAGASDAVESGAAGTVLAGRPALLPGVRGGGLRTLGWPISGPRPRAWVAVVARATVTGTELHELRGWVTHLQRERQWRGILTAEGRLPGPPGTHALAGLLRHTAPADRLERIADRVESR